MGFHTCTFQSFLILLMLLQEHWLSDSELNKLCFRCFVTEVIFGFFFDSVLLHSQPFGGCAILYRQNFVSSVRQVETPSHHFCAVMIDCHNCYCLLFINYLLTIILLLLQETLGDSWDLFLQFHMSF